STLKTWALSVSTTSVGAEGPFRSGRSRAKAYRRRRRRVSTGVLGGARSCAPEGWTRGRRRYCQCEGFQGACQAGESRCAVSRELPVQVVVAVALPCEHGLGLLVGCRARIRLWSLRSWPSARRDCSKYPGSQSPRVHWRSENGATRAGTIDLFDLRIARP